MTDDRQERIRRRAHAIWEQAGRPDGAHQQHWDQATAEIDGEESRPKAKLAERTRPPPRTQAQGCPAGQAQRASGFRQHKILGSSGGAGELAGRQTQIEDPSAPRRRHSPGRRWGAIVAIKGCPSCALRQPVPGLPTCDAGLTSWACREICGSRGVQAIEARGGAESTPKSISATAALPVVDVGETVPGDLCVASGIAPCGPAGQFRSAFEFVPSGPAMMLPVIPGSTTSRSARFGSVGAGSMTTLLLLPVAMSASASAGSGVLWAIADVARPAASTDAASNFVSMSCLHLSPFFGCRRIATTQKKPLGGGEGSHKIPACDVVIRKGPS